MKILFWVTFAIATVSITGIHQKGKSVGGKECPPNTEPSYNRRQVLNRFAEMLNESVPEYKRVFEKGFHVNTEGRGVGFFVYDLTDLSNKETTLRDCIEFKNNHVYHFAPIRKRYSFSHIVILEDDNLKVFRSINCNGKGDRLEDVISYLSEKLKDDKDKQEIISRVKNYRKYGIYTTVDTHALLCEEAR